MNKQEVAKLLGTCAALDVRLARKNEVDQIALVQTWHGVLDADVSLNDALQIVKQHYSDSVDVIMPAVINKGWRIQKRSLAERKHTARMLDSAEQARSESTSMPDSVREFLTSVGIIRKN